MSNHQEITKGRLRRVWRELREHLYSDAEPLAGLSVYSAPGRISYDQAMAGDYRPAEVGETFRPLWSTHWFRIAYRIPERWKGREVLLRFNSCSEGCVWRDGVPLQGLTGYHWGLEDVRSGFQLTPSARGGEEGVLHVEAAINGSWGTEVYFFEPDTKTRHRLGHLCEARLVTLDRAVWDLMWDFAVIKEMAESLPSDQPHQARALAAGNDMANALVLGDRSTYPAARAVAAEFLAQKNGGRNHRVSAMGNAHIDTAWLWPLAETRRKCYRTFSTAVLMMDRYPEYRFVCPQAQQLDWIKRDQPALYDKIRAKAREGRFIPVGGSWTEPDCNIPDGESLVRQMLLGQRFFRREFGSYCREFWNPDVFGYSGALPQILRGAGMRYFLTQKLSVNQYNKPVHSTFLWEGIDGSRVLTHFPPADTYIATVTVEEMLRHYRNYRNADRGSESCYLFGHGDGGGGPTEDMVERLRRLRNVCGLPEVELRGPAEFFARCEADLREPTVWSGELYFENHRGTYTTHAAVKRDNRRSEEMLRDVELLSALACARGAGTYPRAELGELWPLLLLNQFHDIIPGSSVAEVYQDAARDYARILGEGAELRRRALGALVPAEPGENLLVVNTLGWARREVAARPGGGAPVMVAAPSCGYAVLAGPEEEPGDRVAAAARADGFRLENASVRVDLDAAGRVVSFYDKRHRREIMAGPGNRFVMFEDKPEKEDAWNVEIYHLEKRREAGRVLASRLFDEGPLRAGVEIELELSGSASLKQRIFLEACSPRLNFDTSAEWRETDQFLKVEFPLLLRSDHATYDIQFGHLTRPTHANTGWDLARFEVCAHRWADLSEPAYGVALLNDCKYGYSCRGNLLSLSLLRAPKFPDPGADMGSHRFRYAVFPHAGGPQEAGVGREAAAFNQPLEVLPVSAPPETREFFSLDDPAVVLGAVKLAEDGDQIIVRLHESGGGHRTVRLASALPFKGAALVNLLEEEDDPVDWKDGGVSLALRPFQIVTLKLSR